MIKRKQYNNTNKIEQLDEKYDKSLENLKSLINNKYHYKLNKKNYNLINNFFNGLLLLSVDFKDKSDEFIETLESFIFTMCKIEYLDYKNNK